MKGDSDSKSCYWMAPRRYALSRLFPDEGVLSCRYSILPESNLIWPEVVIYIFSEAFIPQWGLSEQRPANVMACLLLGRTQEKIIVTLELNC